MNIESKTLQTLIADVDSTFLNLELQLENERKDVSILCKKIEKLESEKQLEIYNKNQELLTCAFSENIEKDGLGVSGVKLLLELRKYSIISNVDEFLKDLGL